MLVEILENLPQKDLLTCQNVCVLWRNLINQAIGFRLVFGKGSDVWERYDVRLRDLKSISTLGVRQCYFTELEQTNLNEIPTFEFPLGVKLLWMDGFMTREMYARLVSPLSNLRTLAFHISTLAILPLAGLFLSFSKLEVLLVSMSSVNDHRYSNKLALDNVLHLMEQPYNYTSLNKLELHLPFYASYANQLTTAIGKFVMRHKTSLRHLIVEVEAFSQINEALCYQPEIIQRGFGGVNLLTCILKCVLPDPSCMGNLIQIMNGQQYLMSMNCATGYIPFSHFHQPIKSCCRTLTSVQISISTDFGGIDLQRFESCTSLKVLELLGLPKVHSNPPHEEDLEGNIQTRDIKGATFLPDSLQVVNITNIFMTTADAALIIRKPKLFAVYLQNIVRQEELNILSQDAGNLLNHQVHPKPYLISINYNTGTMQYLIADFGSIRQHILLLPGPYLSNDLNELINVYVPDVSPGNDIFKFFLHKDIWRTAEDSGSEIEDEDGDEEDEEIEVEDDEDEEIEVEDDEDEEIEVEDEEIEVEDDEDEEIEVEEDDDDELEVDVEDAEIEVEDEDDDEIEEEDDDEIEEKDYDDIEAKDDDEDDDEDDDSDEIEINISYRM